MKPIPEEGGRPPRKSPDCEGNWKTIPEGAAKIGVNRTTVFRWVRRGFLPARREGRVIFVPMAQLATLARSWPCPACAFETVAPSALAGHVRGLHGAASELKAPSRWSCRFCGWSCAGGGAFAQHLDGHTLEQATAGVADRRPLGRRPRTGPRPTCSEDGCDGLVVGRGLCMRHYQKMRRKALRARHGSEDPIRGKEMAGAGDDIGAAGGVQAMKTTTLSIPLLPRPARDALTKILAMHEIKVSWRRVGDSLEGSLVGPGAAVDRVMRELRTIDFSKLLDPDQRQSPESP